MTLCSSDFRSHANVVISIESDCSVGRSVGRLSSLFLSYIKQTNVAKQKQTVLGFEESGTKHDPARAASKESAIGQHA